MNGVIASIAVVVFSAFLLLSLRNDDMEICMQKHSYDVCFHSLNR